MEILILGTPLGLGKDSARIVTYMNVTKVIGIYLGFFVCLKIRLRGGGGGGRGECMCMEVAKGHVHRGESFGE